MKGLVITTENKMQVREFGEPAYETIGKAVGGWIEVVHPKGLPGPFCMVVNEEMCIRDRYWRMPPAHRRATFSAAAYH